jgi:hypothetical protein
MFWENIAGLETCRIKENALYIQESAGKNSFPCCFDKTKVCNKRIHIGGFLNGAFSGFARFDAAGFQPPLP